MKTRYPLRTIKRKTTSTDEEIFIIRVALRRAARKPKIDNFSFWRFNPYWRRQLANDIVGLSKR